MFPVLKQIRRAGLAVVALGAIAASGQVLAQSTSSGDTVTNTATVNYTVNSVAQTPVTAANSFTVDTVIQLNVTGGITYSDATPGQVGRVATFTVTNTSNIASRFTLAATNENAGANDFDMSNLVVHVDNGDGVYNALDDTATTISSLDGADTANNSILVFVTGDVPAGATDGQQAPLRLTATAIDPSTDAAWVNDTGVDVQGGPAQIVVAQADDFADDTFVVATATLGVSKSSTVITDNLVPPSANPKAIPGATVEYTITIANTGSEAATLQSISDSLPAATAFRPDEYPGAADVSIQVGANPATYCTADADGDGCDFAGNTLTVGSPAITSVAAGATVAVRFRVTIN